jgi:hypothetical protein
MARNRIRIDRSTLADWTGKIAFYLGLIVNRMAEHMKGSGKLSAGETKPPVRNPGAGRTKTGPVWAMLRDDRPWAGPARLRLAIGGAANIVSFRPLIGSRRRRVYTRHEDPDPRGAHSDPARLARNAGVALT